MTTKERICGRGGQQDRHSNTHKLSRITSLGSEDRGGGFGIYFDFRNTRTDRVIVLGYNKDKLL